MFGNFRFQIFKIVKGGVDKAFGQRRETGLHFILTGGGEGRQGSAVEGFFHRDNLILITAAFVVEIFSRQLHRAFIGFGAAVAEKHAIQPAVFHKVFRHIELRFAPVKVGAVAERLGLFGDGFHYRRMAMAEIVHGNAAAEIGVFSALFIIGIKPLPSDESHREAGVCIHQILF